MISYRIKDYSLVKLITEQLSVASKTLYDAAEGRVFLKKGKVQKQFFLIALNKFKTTVWTFKVTIVAPGNWEKPDDTDIRLNDLTYKGVVTGINFDQLPMQIYHTGNSQK